MTTTNKPIGPVGQIGLIGPAGPVGQIGVIGPAGITHGLLVPKPKFIKQHDGRYLIYDEKITEWLINELKKHALISVNLRPKEHLVVQLPEDLEVLLLLKYG